MPLSHVLFVYFVSLLLVFLPSFGLAKMFQKAGVEQWKAFIPFYNTWVMQDLAKRPKHWVFWQFIPVVGWFITPGIFIEFAKLFGKFSIPHHTGAALLAPFYFPYIASQKDTRYIGPDMVKKHKKTAAREWFDAAIFAIGSRTHELHGAIAVAFLQRHPCGNGKHLLLGAVGPVGLVGRL